MTKTNKQLATTRKLLAAIIDDHESTFLNAHPKDVVRAVNDPAWNDLDHLGVHDWRNHVEYVLRNLWGELSLETRLSVLLGASRMAARELWD